MTPATSPSEPPRNPRPGTPTDVPTPAGWGRDVVSLLLFVHLFCVALVLSANLTPSVLQRRLVALVAPYTRLLNFDPNFTRFHLTHGTEEYDDHVLEVVIEGTGSNPERILTSFPDQKLAVRGGLAARRSRNLADMFAFHTYRELDDVTAALARSLGAHAIRGESARPSVVVRCRWHRAQPMDLQDPTTGMVNPPDPQAPEYFETIYEADVFLADDGSPQLVKRASRREVAPTRAGATPRPMSLSPTAPPSKNP